MENKIEIYTSPDGSTQIEVQFEGETVWLNQRQLMDLFQSSKANISEHIKGIFRSGELFTEATVRKFRTVRQEGKRMVSREIEYYNLDVIISIGYRVNSKRGIEFRQWATKRLKDYLIEGVAINEKRLRQKNKEIQVLHDGIRILSRVIEQKAESKENSNWLEKFSIGLKLLDDYDHESLDTKGRHSHNTLFPTMAEYLDLVNHMRLEFNSDVFGKV